MNMKIWGLAAAAVMAVVAEADTVINISGVGAEKKTVSIAVTGPSATAYTKSLAKNLELSGAFMVRPNAQVRITGTTTAIVAEGDGKRVSLASTITDDKSARMSARKFANAVCETFGGQKGFALDRIAFISRTSKDTSELCTCYPDGYDIRQLTKYGESVVGPRWAGEDTILYTSIGKGTQQIMEFDLAGSKRKVKWGFRGLNAGAEISPDGTKAAIVLSVHGNPELYVIDLATKRYERLTKTPNATEGCPSWSPDGKYIVYVSDEARRPNLFIIEVATKKSRRLTYKGVQNVEPEWGRDGRIAYITKRGGAQVAVLNPAEGEASAKLLTEPGNWARPSWSRDMRNVVAERDRALFVVDTKQENGEMVAPKLVFQANGSWINPCWYK